MRGSLGLSEFDQSQVVLHQLRNHRRRSCRLEPEMQKTCRHLIRMSWANVVPQSITCNRIVFQHSLPQLSSHTMTTVTLVSLIYLKKPLKQNYCISREGDGSSRKAKTCVRNALRRLLNHPLTTSISFQLFFPLHFALITPIRFKFKFFFWFPVLGPSHPTIMGMKLDPESADALSELPTFVVNLPVSSTFDNIRHVASG